MKYHYDYYLKGKEGESPFIQLCKLLKIPYELDSQSQYQYFDMTLEQLMAQIAVGVEKAIRKPEAYKTFLVSLGGKDASEAIAVITSTKKEPDEIEKSYGVLRQCLDQGLDEIQLFHNTRWRNRIRWEACIISGLIGLATLLLSQSGPAVKAVVLVSTFTWGGAFAWLARDISAGIERWRS